MSTVYHLIETSSNSIINLITWDGSNPEDMALYTSSFGYALIEITGSDEYYGSLTGSTTASLPSGSNYFDVYDTSYLGNFTGIFSGSSSGSFTGSFNDYSGSLGWLDGWFTETNQILIDPTNYGILYYNSSGSEDWLEHTPQCGTFQIDTGLSWNSAVTALVLPGDPSGSVWPSSSNFPNYDRYILELENILSNGLVDSIITLISIEHKDTYKKFKIKNITQHKREYLGGGVFKFYARYMGTDETELVEIGDTSRFTGIVESCANNKYFELEVEEIASSLYQFSIEDHPNHYTSFTYGADPSTYGEGFYINFELSIKKRREIQVHTGSKDWVMPNWASKVTAICIGAGGGGGGGGAGFLHSGSFSDFYTFYDGSPGDIPTLGHNVVLGGGGGAGGNVAWTEYTNIDIPNGTTVSLNIGLGGKGGIGGNPTIQREKSVSIEGITVDEKINSIKNYFDNFIKFKKLGLNYEWDDETIIDNELYPNNNKSITRSGESNATFSEYDGKKGGDVSFKPRNAPPSTIETKAAGGRGGHTGFGIMSYYEMWHRLCYWPIHDTGIIGVFGGGSTLDNTVGGSNILIGGPGGFGVGMPLIFRIENFEEIDTYAYDDALSSKIYLIDKRAYYMDSKLIYMANAPSLPCRKIDSENYPNYLDELMAIKLGIPSSSAYNNGPSLYGNGNITLPYGSTNNQTIASYTTPSDYAPTGGGGGTGQSFHGVYTGSYNMNKMTGSFQIQPPAFQSHTEYSNLIYSYIKRGKGGRNLLSSNVLVKQATLGNGGMGGHYNMKNMELTTQPQSGSLFGGGGGGGAGVYSEYGGQINLGQNGADGADGAIILIIES